MSKLLLLRLPFSSITDVSAISQLPECWQAPCSPFNCTV